ncbi:MAG: hypothetical protein R3308_00225, partial [Thiohalobacterales bacterium]|nr:hypothetical protein [Thiohalobacterales bacterium]
LLDGLVFALLLAAFLLVRDTGTLEQIFMLAVGACGLATVTAGLVAGRHLRTYPAATGAPFVLVLGTAWPLWITGITLFALGKVDLWILGLFRELDEVGVYGAVSRLATFTSFTLLIANAVVPPLIAEMHSRQDHRAMEHTLRSVATLSLIPSLAIVIVFAAWPGGLLGLLYGDYYRTGSLALLILAAGHLVNVACGSCGYVLMMTRHQVLMMVITLLSGGMTILVGTQLAPGYGAAGVATGMSAGLILQNLLMLAAVRRHLGIWTHARLRIPAIGRRLEEQGS